MAVNIYTNPTSLTAQSNLNSSKNAMTTAIQRLSSGLRINSAKDDAAGQAISNRFTSNINGLTQASRNANDGISIAQTTEGALNEINDNLQNIRRLTVQATNGTNSASDRKSIQDEIDQRLQEIDRISDQTEFNGVKVLSADQKLTIQVGANDGQTIDIQLNKMDGATLGMDGFIVDGVNPADLSDATTMKTEVTLASAASEVDGDKFDKILQDKDGNLYLHNSDGTYVTASIDATTGNLTVGAAVTPDQQAALKGAKEVNKGDKITANVDVTGKGVKTDGKGNFYVESNGAYNVAELDTSSGDVTAGEAVDVNTTDPLATIDAALSQVDKLRSGLGAVQNRFDSVIKNLDSTVNNLSASQSRIQDADYAVEVSNLTRAQILQQAGTSVLAQANSMTQNALSLLQ